MKTIGVILTGGQSRRFGEDKALYEIEGVPMYEHVANVLSNHVDKVVISTNKYLASKINGYEIIIDKTYENKGPLGGIYEVVKEYGNVRFIVMSCDTPYVPSVWISELVNCSKNNENTLIITNDDNHLHPTIAVYQHENLFDTLTRITQQDVFKIRVLIEKLPYQKLNYLTYGLNKRQFTNVNYKSDLNGGI